MANCLILTSFITRFLGALILLNVYLLAQMYLNSFLYSFSVLNIYQHVHVNTKANHVTTTFAKYFSLL